MKKIKILLLPLLGFIVYLPAQSNQGQTIIRAPETQVEQSKAAAVDKVTLSREAIERSGAGSLAEVLQTQSSVRVLRYGSRSQAQFMQIRGSASRQVLVLLDGIPLNTASGSAVDLSLIPLDWIESLTLVKGASAARYGSASVGGVLLIESRQAEEGRNFTLSQSGGRWNTFENRGLFSSQVDKGWQPSLLFQWNYFSSKADYRFFNENAEEDLTRSNESAQALNLRLLLKADINDKSAFTLDFRLQTNVRGAPGLIEFPSVSASSAEFSDQVRLNYSRKKQTELNLDYRFSQKKLSYSDPDYPLGSINDYHKMNSHSVHFMTSWPNGKNSLLWTPSLHFDYQLDELNSSALEVIEASGLSSSGEITRQTASVAYVADWQWDARIKELSSSWLWSSAYRLYFFNNESARPVYDLALNYQFGEKEKDKLFFRHSRAYQKPGLNDLFWSPSAFSVGNQHLQPEESLSIETGLETSLGQFALLDFSLFQRDVDQWIQWSASADGRWRPNNLAKVQFRGSETGVQTKNYFRRWKAYLIVNANYSYLFAWDAEESSTSYGKQLIDRPYEQASANLKWMQVGKYSLIWDTRYLGYRFINAQNTEALPAYWVHDMKLTYNFSFQQQVRLSVDIENIFNKYYVDLNQYPVPGLNWFFTLSWTLD